MNHDTWHQFVMDNWEVTSLSLLDLSVTFDTVDNCAEELAVL